MNTPSSIPSPVTGGRTKLIKKISTDEIQKMYKDFDVSIYFNDTKEISLFQCEDTKYRFYYPFNVAGDEKYYTYLSKNDWYYMPWKWEHEVAMKEMSNGLNVLEIGCGNGGFLSRCSRTVATCVGIETNEEAVNKCKRKGLNVIKSALEELKGMEERFDIICSFQVLEHVPGIASFISSAVKMLKTGGKLIIAVPNNGSFIKKDIGDLLNMPPHHMGLWNDESLTNISKYFGLKKIMAKTEPLQKYHVAYYFNTVFGNRFKTSTKIGRHIKRIYSYVLAKVIHVFKRFITGHTILVIYEKL